MSKGVFDMRKTIFALLMVVVLSFSSVSMINAVDDAETDKAQHKACLEATESDYGEGVCHALYLLGRIFD